MSLEYKKILIIKKLIKITTDKFIIEEIIKKCCENNEDLDELIGVFTHKRNPEDYGFNSLCFKKFKSDEDEYLKFLENPNVIEGIFVCKKCNSKKIITTSKQTRKSDESTTVFAICTNCNNKWCI